MGFTEISLFLVVAAFFGAIARYFKQPVMMGYLVAGILLSYFGFIADQDAVGNLGKIGVALLLFLVGIEMNLRELPSIGKVALFTGIGQILFTLILGFSIASLLGFALVPALYIAVALTFSSTIIIVKLLGEKGDLGSLYGKVAVGFLLVQDFVAVAILVFLSGLGTGGGALSSVLLVFFKAAILFAVIWWLSKRILPFIFAKFIATSPEVLFVGSIAWALGFAAFVGGPFGLSFEIGGFLAGLALSNLPEHLGIAAKTRPLRDFFLTIFFLALGTQLLISDIFEILTPALIFSALVLIGNPLVVMIIMGLMRFKRRTSFLASVTVAQIFEFSFILMAMGRNLGHVGDSEVAMIILVGVFTMTISTYLILYSDKVYKRIKNHLAIFERKKIKEENIGLNEVFEGHVVLVGSGRTGRNLLAFFKKQGITFLVVDYNPKVFSNLAAEKVPVILGDIDDSDVLELAQVEKAKMIISTVSTLSDNLEILDFLRNNGSKALTILKATSKEEAVKLYEAGATYVLLPEVIAGEYLRHIFVSHGLGESRLTKMGQGHFRRLTNYATYG